MNDEEIVALGMFCEELMQNQLFQNLCQQFEQNCFQHMMATQAHELKKREGIFAAFSGVKDFLGLMTVCVETKNKLTQPSPADAEEEDI